MSLFSQGFKHLLCFLVADSTTDPSLKLLHNLEVACEVSYYRTTTKDNAVVVFSSKL